VIECFLCFPTREFKQVFEQKTSEMDEQVTSVRSDLRRRALIICDAPGNSETVARHRGAMIDFSFASIWSREWNNAAPREMRWWDPGNIYATLYNNNYYHYQHTTCVVAARKKAYVSQPTQGDLRTRPSRRECVYVDLVCIWDVHGTGFPSPIKGVKFFNQQTVRRISRHNYGADLTDN
jgi:hypothetical protein